MRPTKTLVATALMALTAAPALAQDCEDGFRLFEHFSGETCIPEDPQRIVSLQDINILLPLLELGVTPTASLGHQLPNGDTIFRFTEGYDTSSVEWVGSYSGPIDPEAIAVVEPDLIIGAPRPEGSVELLGDVAPVIIIDVFGGISMDEALFQIADAVNRTDRAEAMQAEFEARAAEVTSILESAPSTTSISIIEYRDDGTFKPFEEFAAMGLIAESIPLNRPAPEQGLGLGEPELSMETIGDHAADVMFLMAWDQDADGHSATFAEYSSHPLVQLLPVTQAGQLFLFDGAAMAGMGWEKAMNGLEQIAEVVTREDLNRDIVIE